MTEIVDQLAKAIYTAEIDLAVEGEFDSPYYRRVSLDSGSIRAVEIVAYEDLPQRVKDSYFDLAQAVLKPLREKMLR